MKWAVQMEVMASILHPFINVWLECELSEGGSAPSAGSVRYHRISGLTALSLKIIKHNQLVLLQTSFTQ